MGPEVPACWRRRVGRSQGTRTKGCGAYEQPRRRCLGCRHPPKCCRRCRRPSGHRVALTQRTQRGRRRRPRSRRRQEGSVVQPTGVDEVLPQRVDARCWAARQVEAHSSAAPVDEVDAPRFGSRHVLLLVRAGRGLLVADLVPSDVEGLLCRSHASARLGGLHYERCVVPTPWGRHVRKSASAGSLDELVEGPGKQIGSRS
jgi:hypothetical protein